MLGEPAQVGSRGPDLRGCTVARSAAVSAGWTIAVGTAECRILDGEHPRQIGRRRLGSREGGKGERVRGRNRMASRAVSTPAMMIVARKRGVGADDATVESGRARAKLRPVGEEAVRYAVG